MPDIGGNSAIVEIDESKFGKRKYIRGHQMDGVWVLGLVERTEERRIILVAVDRGTQSTLFEKITANVNFNSHLFTDGWKAYRGLDDIYNSHSTVVHEKHFKDPITGVHTNTIEGNWSAIKLQVPFRNRTKTLVTLYLVRFMLLRNEKQHPLLAIIKYIF